MGIPRDKVNEVCIDLKAALWKVVELLFPKAKLVVDYFYVIADSNKRMDEARRIEQVVHCQRKVQILKNILNSGVEAC